MIVMRINHISIALICALTILLYSNTFFNGFVYDDYYFIRDNVHIRSLQSIPSFFTTPSAGDLYRPLRSVLYTVTYSLWGLNPIGYHLNAILLHTAISILVYLIASRLTG